MVLETQKIQATMDPAKRPDEKVEEVVLDQHQVDADTGEEPSESKFSAVKRAIYTRIMAAWSVVASIFARAGPHKELKEEKVEESASLVVDNAGDGGDGSNNSSATNETIAIAPPAADQKPQ